MLGCRHAAAGPSQVHDWKFLLLAFLIKASQLKNNRPQTTTHKLAAKEQCKLWRTEWWWTQSFKHVYVAWQRAVCPSIGPADIYQPQHWPLFVLYLGSLHAVIQWDRLEALWGVKCGPIPSATLLNLFFGPVCKQRATRRINEALKWLGVPPSN